MGAVLDLLQGIPVNAVLREELALADALLEGCKSKVAELEKENAALRSEVASVKSANKELRVRQKQLSQQLEGLKAQLSAPSKDVDLDETAHSLLKALSDGQVYSANGFAGMRISEGLLKHRLGVLCGAGLVKRLNQITHVGYEITQAGLDWLDRRGELK